MEICIEASDLPGSGPGFACAPEAGPVYVGVQRKDRPGEVLEPHRGDAPSAVWTLECVARTTADGVELTGRYVQDRLGGRFVYLSWGTLDGHGVFSMFRRAKLMLADVDAAVLDAAAGSGRLVARLGLSDARGGPLCGRVRPGDVAWTAETPG
ncbi:DUF5990 family protein [uncultured Streptomyces sp.]|uniref:DUF5990 family protein n=1 Tax=uncultured Streptomyces sp. TaxID=174707 RepID=UPI002628A300|nr:DUF5990 family protein [uncultured Streptomyces sp.]